MPKFSQRYERTFQNTVIIIDSFLSMFLLSANNFGRTGCFSTLNKTTLQSFIVWPNGNFLRTLVSRIPVVRMHLLNSFIRPLTPYSSTDPSNYPFTDPKSNFHNVINWSIMADFQILICYYF